MTQLSDSNAPPPPPRLTWKCPVCGKRLVLRSSTETEERFRARCATHERNGNVCRANLLTHQLTAGGMETLRHEDAFVQGYTALNMAGLVTQHLTHVVQPSLLKRTSKRRRREIKRGAEYAVLPDPIIPAPWAPSWALRYERYLREKHKLPLTQRIASLTEAAATPENRERVQAFLALAGETVDLGDGP